MSLMETENKVCHKLWDVGHVRSIKNLGLKHSSYKWTNTLMDTLEQMGNTLCPSAVIEHVHEKILMDPRWGLNVIISVIYFMYSGQVKTKSEEKNSTLANVLYWMICLG